MVSQEDKVSVILPTFNRADTLGRSIDSVLSQSYKNLELIVVDDGSTDGTKKLISSIRDERLFYVQTELNRGAAAARNTGLQYAAGGYVAFQDSDDSWRPDKLRLQMEKMKKEQAGFCYHKMQYDFGEGRTAVLPQENISSDQKNGDIFSQLLYENMAGCPALLVRRECVEEIGGFDTDFKALEDYDFVLRLAKKFYAAFVDRVLIDVSYTQDSVSLQAENYLDASCMLLSRYQKDYLATGNFDHRVLRILEDAQRIGMREHYLTRLMELVSEKEGKRDEIEYSDCHK